MGLQEKSVFYRLLSIFCGFFRELSGWYPRNAVGGGSEDGSLRIQEDPSAMRADDKCLFDSFFC